MDFNFGFERYGRVDRVPGLFHVSTEFLTTYYLPLFPIKTYLVLEDGSERIIPIGAVYKSLFFAYLRFALIAGAILGMSLALGVLILFGMGDDDYAVGAAKIAGGVTVSVACFGAWLGTYRLTRASPTRALALARRHGVSLASVEFAFAELARKKRADFGSTVQASDDPVASKQHMVGKKFVEKFGSKDGRPELK